MSDDSPPASAPDASDAPDGQPPFASPAPLATPAATTGPDVPAWRPNYVFLAVLSIVSLAADLGSKAWAKGRLADAPIHGRTIEVVQDHLAFRFAENKGGAWGLLQGEPEAVRRPFFLAISAVAIVFIVSLYRKLTPQQTALKWGLPLVLGGALGNLVNRIQYNYVVDFIDVRASWIRSLNALVSPQSSTDHWPTFNIADVAIVVGVILMAVDMFTPRKAEPKPALSTGAGDAPAAAAQTSEAAEAPGTTGTPGNGAAAPKET